MQLLEPVRVFIFQPLEWEQYVPKNSYWVDTGVSEASKGLEGSMNACACEPRKCCVCTWTSETLSLPAEEKEGDIAVHIYVLSECCMHVLLSASLACGNSCGCVSVLCL